MKLMHYHNERPDYLIQGSIYTKIANRKSVSPKKRKEEEG
jgi:hypothetical protein